MQLIRLPFLAAFPRFVAGTDNWHLHLIHRERSLMTRIPCTACALGFAVLLLAGCADETLTGPAYYLTDVPEARATLLSVRDGNGPVFVFNTQLRPVEADIPSEARGHLQLKIRQVSGVDPSPFYEVEWKGKLFNPAGELFTGGDVKGSTPDDSRPVLRVFDVRSSEAVIVLEGAGRLPTAQAEVLIASPGRFGVLFTTAVLPDGALAGDFSGVDPTPF